ncbi:DsbA family protein [uncultured Sulfitobacter sp.]|uniref:2-hydroxychromene-2-carboxylate isomerase n=1 Tax=uncultured Sulfitobacter sp. TaxID=191468 RepID=UPI002609D382|nr:DsbA family protein [uncultured Sulfitobacter sp.]
MSDKVIEYFYSAHSAYAYLGAKELARISQATGWRIVHRPFDFHPVINAAGATGFKKRSAAHIDYFFGRELSRWAQWRDLPILDFRPTFHDNPLALANGMIIAASDPDRISFAILQAHWRDDADIADPDTLLALATACSENGPELIEAALSDSVQRQHDANTQEAIDRNVFGSPAYFIRGDMFYGQDRLEMVARAIAQPFAP